MNNKVIIASAGSGKTYQLINEIKANPSKKILVATYTLSNREEIYNRLCQELEYIPRNINIKTWYSFLLQDCARPYQNLDDKCSGRIVSIEFVNSQSAKYKEETEKSHYFDNANYIYSDKISKFIYNLDEKENGIIMERLEELYDIIMIDEVQDLAGWDYNLIDKILQTRIKTIFVGDPRQCIYSTNPATKNSSYKNDKMIEYYKKKESEEQCVIITSNNSYRCNQSICDFADKLFPKLSVTKSKTDYNESHQGIYIITKEQVEEYCRIYQPKILCYSKKSKTLGLNATNFGIVKGQSYDRVLIFPTDNFKQYLKTGDVKLLKPETKSKYYVAITRARYSVSIVYEGNTCLEDIRRY